MAAQILTTEDFEVFKVTLFVPKQLTGNFVMFSDFYL